jgi:subtilase family serine protease
LNYVRLRSLALSSLQKKTRFGSSFLLVSLALSQAAAGEFHPISRSLRHPEAAMASAVRADANENVFFAVSLAPRDLAGLQDYVQQVSNPASIYYRQFITPAEVAVRFGPAQSDIDSVVSFLASKGLTVNEVSANGFVITAEGTASQIEDTFHTSLGYVPRVDGPGTYRTNLTALSAPSSIACKIVSIDGIDTSIRMQRRATTTTLNPTLYRAAFSESSLYSGGYYGTGVNIAIANWDGYRLNNIPYWTSKYSLPVPSGGSGSNIHIVEVGSGTTYGSGAPGGEGDLDLQAVLMAAPLANIYDYDDATSDTAAPITTLSKISSDNIADIVTESYGWETSDNSTYYGSTWTSAYNIHLSMAAQGITYMAATGDSGTANFPSRGARYGYPDIDPNVLAVGGSIATVNSSTGALSSESSWGVSGGVGGTGGFDPYDTSAHGFAFNVAPSYETTYISSKTKTYNYRLLPDLVSSAGGQNGLGQESGADADWALLIYYNDPSEGYPVGTQIQIDGTSIASPATAGSCGAVWQELFKGVSPNSSRSNVRLGALQSFLYANGSNTSVF